MLNKPKEKLKITIEVPFEYLEWWTEKNKSKKQSTKYWIATFLAAILIAGIIFAVIYFKIAVLQ